MSRPRQRRLFLHLSALSDAEYASYVEALHDVLDDCDTSRLSDEELEAKLLGVREARAWMKGRFRDVSAGEIDKILHLFMPDMAQKDSISGGQFLAALRLLMHARHGAEIVENLAFVQADPSSPTSAHPLGPFSTFTGTPNVSDPPTPDLPASVSAPVFSKASTTASSTSTVRAYSHINTNPFKLDPVPTPPNLPVRRSSLSSAPASSPPVPSVPPPVPSSHSKPLPRFEAASGTSSRPSDTSLTSVTPGSTNPFLQRAKTHSGAMHGSNAGVGAGAGTGTGIGRTPPLPPRKPPHMSTTTGPSSSTVVSTTLFPPPLPKSLSPGNVSIPLPLHPSHSPHVSLSPPGTTLSPNLISPLMKQSLAASKHGQTLKRAQAQAAGERVLEVIRSSSSMGTSPPAAGGTLRDRGRTSRSPTKGGRRPVPSPPRSAFSASSMGSLEQVAAARVGSPEGMSSVSASASSSSASSRRASQHFMTTSTPAFATPSSSSPAVPHTAPPTHPDRRPSVGSGLGGTPKAKHHQRSPSYHSTFSSYSAPAPHPPPSPTRLVVETDDASGPGQAGMTRTTRSHSMHQSSPTSGPGATSGTGRVSPPLPPPRRKRPESVQVLPTPRVRDLEKDEDAVSPFGNAFATALQERERSSAATSAGASPLSFTALQRTLSTLQSKAQPTLDRARYKAEAGLSRRGFVPNGHGSADSLVHSSDTYNEEDDDGGGMDEEFDVLDRERDLGWGADEDGRSRGRNKESFARERDDLKLPEGEGWTQL